MRKLSGSEILSMATILDMEKNGLIIAKAMQELISDEELKKQAEAGVLATEQRVKGLQQFINENKITDNDMGVH